MVVGIGATDRANDRLICVVAVRTPTLRALPSLRPFMASPPHRRGRREYRAGNGMFGGHHGVDLAEGGRLLAERDAVASSQPRGRFGDFLSSSVREYKARQKGGPQVA